VTSAMQRRLAALEVQRWPGGSYVVRMPDRALDDAATRDAAVMEHRRRTGWMGPVVLAPLELTVGEWLAKYGRAST
jgi:hypothetical protein